MSHATEIKQLLRRAHRQGFEAEHTKAGHIKVTNSSDGRYTRISATPRSRRGVMDAIAKLARIGYVKR